MTNRIGEGGDNKVLLQAQGAVDEASFASKTGRDAMENFQSDLGNMMNMLGGILKGVLGVLGKGGAGAKGGKGGGGKGG